MARQFTVGLRAFYINETAARSEILPSIYLTETSGTAGTSGTLATIETADSIALAGDVAAPAGVTGALTAVETIDFAALAGTVEGVSTGSLVALETTDYCRMAAVFVPSRRNRMPYASSQDYTWESGRPLERPKKWT